MAQPDDGLQTRPQRHHDAQSADGGKPESIRDDIQGDWQTAVSPPTPSGKPANQGAGSTHGGNSKTPHGGKPKNIKTAVAGDVLLGLPPHLHWPSVAATSPAKAADPPGGTSPTLIFVSPNGETGGEMAPYSPNLTLLAELIRSQQPVRRTWRIEQKLNDGRHRYLRWRWQRKDKNGKPIRTKSGGYARGSRYIGKQLANDHPRQN